MKKWIVLSLIVFSHFGYTQEPYLKITVSNDGKSDFLTIQEAINSIRDLGPGEVQIFIKNGTYKEKIRIPSWKHRLSLIGESKENTLILYDDYSGKTDEITNKKMTTFDSYTLLVEGDDVKIENLTIQNSWCKKGQAVALHVEGDRFIAKNCNLIGCQDTLYAATGNSRQYYENCYIEGTTDFIFGQATAVFQNCTIKSLANSYVTAAATTEYQKFGFVFFGCQFIAAEGISKVYLGRPWRPYAQTVLINCQLGNHILPEGWDPWKGDKMFPEKEKTTFYAEFGNKGKGANHSSRVNWAHQLTKKEVGRYTLETIFGNWNPNEN